MENTGGSLENIPLPGLGDLPNESSNKKPVKSTPIKLIRTKLAELKQRTEGPKNTEQPTSKAGDTAKVSDPPKNEKNSDLRKIVVGNPDPLSSNVVDEMFQEFLKNKFKSIEEERDDSQTTDSTEKTGKSESQEASSEVCSKDDVFDKAQPDSEEKKGSAGKLSFGLKISETSAAFISSGQPAPKENAANIEEGELTDSDATDGDDSSDIDDLYGDLDKNSETGSIADKDDSSSKKKKKKKHKHKSKKKKKSKDKEKEKDGSSRSRSKERSKDSRKKRKHSRSRSPRKHRKHSDESYFDKQQGIWRTPEKKDNSEAEKFWGKDYDRIRRRSRSRSRSRDRRRNRSSSRDRDRQYSRSRRPRSRSRDRIDKDRLRAIAVAKAYANMRAGVGPNVNLKSDEVACLRAGGRSIDELTQVCQKIAEKQLGDPSSSEDEGARRPASDEEGPFLHHPFKVNPASNIVMNIRNSKMLPILSQQEKLAQSGKLRMEFPVSSGSQHRAKEWVPVEKPSPSAAAGSAAAAAAMATTSTATGSNGATTQGEVKVFEDPPTEPVDIGSVVSERLKAVRKLQENPNDVQAMTEMHKAQKKMNQWAVSKNLPGQFVGTTGAQVLSVQELSGTHPRNQAWFKKDQFQRAAPVNGGVGKFLLQKMGWKEGEGLGKNNEGPAEPLLLNFKVDRKGLTAQGEGSKKNKGPPPSIPTATKSIPKDLSGKHPVSALVEICNKRKWGSPDFIVVHESGPDHKKNFLFKVKVNNIEYQPSVASNTKKLAKAQAATACLQALGMVPR